MTAYAVLLRGVNVGGRAKLPMATLRDVLSGLGYADVTTYLQSGNAVLTTGERAATLTRRVQEALAASVGREVATTVRTADQLAAVVAGWPFDPDAPPTTKHVVFLRAPADPAAYADLPLDDVLPDRMQLSGSEVYLSTPNGLGRSKLAELLNRRGKGGGTQRNWNTVTALRDLTAELS